jgi:hypothetical protein
MQSHVGSIDREKLLHDNHAREKRKEPCYEDQSLM